MAHYFEIIFEQNSDSQIPPSKHTKSTPTAPPASSFYETKINSLPTCPTRVSIFYITPYPFALIPQDP